MDAARMAELAIRATHATPQAWRAGMLAELPADAQAVLAGRPKMGLAPHQESSTLYFYDAIGGWDGTRAIDVATALTQMSGPVAIRFNCPGGVIFEGAAIYNALCTYRDARPDNVLTSWIDGVAASAATFIMQAASPYDAVAGTGGVRQHDNAMVMTHDGRGIALGTADEMREYAELLDALSDTAAEIYAQRAGNKSAADWRTEMRGGDTWRRAAAAKEAGLVDVVVTAGGKPEVDDEPEERASVLSMFAVPQTPAIDHYPEPITSAALAGLRLSLKGALSA